MTTIPRKVLMLHGYAQSGTVFSKRIGSVRKAIGKDIDLVFVDAPHALTPADLAESFGTSTSIDELGGAESAEVEDPALAPRGWWNPTTGAGLEESFAFFRDILRKDHYEGVFGFSQGAGMAVLLAALLEKPDVHPPFLVDGKPPHPPLKFCISVAGLRPSGPLPDAILLPSFSTQTLHILGRNDVIVVEEKTQKIIALTANSRVEYHDGGHFVPSKANWRRFFKDYLHDPLATISSPDPASASQPPSGAVTPAS